MTRTVSTPLVRGNDVHLQFDGPGTFERWVEAIESAERFVHFENYVVRDDRTGRRFRDVLVERARAGVEVRVLYDWVGCWATPGRYWRPFREASVDVRAFNRPSIRDPFGLLQRDHRKLVCVDGHTAFIGGFCVGDEWAGGEKDPPWRDTGVEIRGPAAAQAGRAFERIWGEVGGTIPDGITSPDSGEVSHAGEVPVWIIEGEPWRTRVYRSTQLVAATARHRLWITDPYFVAPRSVREALVTAARDGVDVRVLVPAHNNWPWVGSLSRGGYRQLLSGGVRIFEWQGPMIHAKTAVADGLWSRVGSSNLNSASLLGNWELDAGILDRELATQLEAIFQADLTSSVEIILPRAVPITRVCRSGGEGVEGAVRDAPGGAQIAPGGTRIPDRAGPAGEVGDPNQGDSARRAGAPPAGSGPEETHPGQRSRPAGIEGERGSLEGPEQEPLEPGPRWHSPLKGTGKGSGSGARTLTLADVARAGSALGESIAGHRTVGREDRTVLGTVAVILITGAVVALLFPRATGWILAAFLGWIGLALGLRVIAQSLRARQTGADGDPGNRGAAVGKPATSTEESVDDHFRGEGG